MRKIKYQELLSILLKEKNMVLYIEYNQKNLIWWLIKNSVPNSNIFLYLSYSNNKIEIQWDDKIFVEDIKKLFYLI